MGELSEDIHNTSLLSLLFPHYALHPAKSRASTHSPVLAALVVVVDTRQYMLLYLLSVLLEQSLLIPEHILTPVQLQVVLILELTPSTSANRPHQRVLPTLRQQVSTIMHSNIQLVVFFSLTSRSALHPLISHLPTLQMLGTSHSRIFTLNHPLHLPQHHPQQWRWRSV